MLNPPLKVVAAEAVHAKYAGGSLTALLEGAIRALALTDARQAISMGARAPWGSRSHVPINDRIFLLPSLTEADRASATRSAAYVRFFREAISINAPHGSGADITEAA